MSLILRILLRKRYKPSKDCVLASEILYIYLIRWENTFFLVFCSHLASKKSTFQLYMLVACGYFRFWLCCWFLKYFRWKCWTNQNSKKECILTGEILDIYPTCSNLVEFNQSLACTRSTFSSIFGTKQSYIESLRLLSSNRFLQKLCLMRDKLTKQRILASEILDIYPIFRKH